MKTPSVLRHTFETIVLDFIMKVAECRAALYPLHTEHITLSDAYNIQREWHCVA